MRVQSLFTIVALVALAALVGLVVRSLVPTQRAATTVASKSATPSHLPQIWVAHETLDTGKFIDAADFEAHDWPEAAILPEHLKVGDVQPTDIAGAVTRERIAKGEPILMAKLARPGERSFLAAVLRPGMRAISIAVDSVSANSGLVLPGDRVDIILTQSVAASGGGGRRVGETIARAVRVLAVGTSLNAPQDSKDVNDRPSTVTLEVTPKQAEAVSVAAALGDIKLALRSLPATASDQKEDDLASAGADLSKPEHPTWGNDVSSALSGGSNLVVMRGSSTSAAQ
jgi:pilus assembly protein CpaB